MGYSGTILFPGHQTGTRNRWEDNITIYLREIRWGIYELESSGSGYGPMNTVMNLRVPLNVGNFLTE
jgi:hypothetical protein